jgi:hypothetical protein
MGNQGTIAACRAALVAFALIFLFSVFRGCSVLGASFRGSLVALAIFIAVKLVYRLFFSALVEELSAYITKEKAAISEEGQEQ